MFDTIIQKLNSKITAHLDSTSDALVTALEEMLAPIISSAQIIQICSRTNESTCMVVAETAGNSNLIRSFLVKNSGTYPSQKS